MISADGIKREHSAKLIDINSSAISIAVQSAINLCKETEITRSIKTPISLLQEIATKCSCQPVYENISTEGQVHEPLFIYKVTVGDISAIAKGASKKRAKHAAALAYLNEIRFKSIDKNNTLADNIEVLIKSINEANSDETHFDDPNNDETLNKKLTEADKSNPVGDLLELTQKLSLRPPKFEYGEEEGLPHNRMFTCYSHFDKFKEVGTGSSKKVAKRLAAQKLLDKLKEQSNLNELKIEKIGDANINDFSSGKDKNKKSNHNFFSSLKNSNKTVISRLLSKSEILSDEDLKKELFYQLATEENFEFKFYNLGKKKTGLDQVLLQTKTNPNLVVNGVGLNMNEALENAAFNILSLLKLLCSR